MRKSLLLTAALLTGCGGGVTPELYALAVDYFTLPDSCYSNGMQPSSVVVSAPPGLLQVQVWDGPDNTAVLEVEQGGRSIDMGAAPNVAVGGLFKGTKGDKGWTFVSETVDRATVAGNTVTDTTKAEFTFDRGAQTFKGTAALTASRTCTGSACSGTNPACAVSGITLTGTRIAVDYQRAP
jgi:hypothetical protein